MRFEALGWETVSDEAKDFVARLLEKDPAGRMTAKDALKHPWLINYASGTKIGNKLGVGMRMEKFKAKFNNAMNYSSDTISKVGGWVESFLGGGDDGDYEDIAEAAGTITDIFDVLLGGLV